MQSIDEAGGFGFGARLRVRPLRRAAARTTRRRLRRACACARRSGAPQRLAGWPGAEGTDRHQDGYNHRRHRVQGARVCCRACARRARGVQRGRADALGPTRTTAAAQDGVVLGADTRSTNGDTVADKNCEKIHYIAPNIYCCGAGTAADTEAVTGARAACARARLACQRR
jgi:hypothetical protein